MAVREYVCKKTAEVRFEAYVNLRSEKYPVLRVQKYKKCRTKAEAEREEKRLIKTAAEELLKLEGQGALWSVVLHKWEAEAKELKRNPTTLKPISDKVVHQTVGLLKLWTENWLERPCNDLSMKDGKDLLLECTNEDLRPASIRKIKTYVNLVFKFGVQEGLIEAHRSSPVHGIPFDLSDGDTLPEILTVAEARKLLLEAKVRNHQWYAIWITALMTGMRSSELYALQKKNVHLEEGMIRVCESWDWKNNCAKDTKAKYWRNTPIATTLRPVIEELMQANPESPYLFPRIREWENGEQAVVLRQFCEVIGIPSVRFHTLRACFATHLLATGVDTATVMAIGGWSNYRTFKIYLRLAGITERHKTENLGKLLIPNDDTIRDYIAATYQQAA